MKLNFKKFTPLVLTILVIGTIILLVINAFKKQSPKIIGTFPADGSPSFATVESLNVQFDQDIDSTQFSVSSSPDETWKVVQLTPNTLSLEHDKYLQTNTKYTLNILKNNKTIGSFSFTTAAGQGDPRYYQQVITDLNNRYPLAAKTPYDTNAYEVVYSAPLTLEIRRKNNLLPDTEIIDQVKAWVKDNGLDPATHKYTITSPTP